MQTIEALAKEKNIEPAVVIQAMEEAVVTASRKFYKGGEDLKAKFNPENGQIELFALKTIVAEVTNPDLEISMAEAKGIYGDDAGVEVGDQLEFQKRTDVLGRIAAQTAKQVIFQKVREAELEVVQKEYAARTGDLVNGIILGQERRNYIVDLGKTEAILPAHEQIPRETYRRGDRVKGYLLEVKRTLRDVQVILSRTHPNFIVKLFEAEVPEIAEKIVEIKGVVREPGDRTKIAVVSRDRAVDPVGACVGMKGSRVQAVVRELRGEKIDIIAWTPDSRVFIAEALNPAVIEKVGVDEEKKSALVVVADNQLSLAIGRNGQNVRLAAKLTGWKIDIIGASEYEKERVVRDQESRAAIAHQLQEQHAKLVEADSAAAAAQQEALADEGGQAAGQAESGSEEKAVG